MTGSDWAAVMIPTLRQEFEVTRDRATRITDRVRWLVSAPEYKHLRERGLLNDEFNDTFTDGLVESLKGQSGKTLEERWNGLVREFGLYDELGEEVLLTRVEPFTSSITPRENAAVGSVPQKDQLSLAEMGALYDRALVLKETAKSEPSRVDVDEVLDILKTPTASPRTHATAAHVLLIASTNGREIDNRFVDPIVSLLDRPSLDADELLLSVLRKIAKNDPSSILDVKERIFDEVKINEAESTRIALECCTQLATHDPGSVLNLTPKLSELIASDEHRIRLNASYLLARVARDHPTEVKPLSPKLVELLPSDDEIFQTNLLAALGHLATFYSSLGSNETTAIAALVDSSSPKVRANAVGLMADVARDKPRVVNQHSAVIGDCLLDSDETVRANAVSALLHIGLDQREEVEDILPALIELVDDPSPLVRRNVARTLGTMEAEVAIEQLRSLSDSDPDDEVREIASWAIRQISK